MSNDHQSEITAGSLASAVVDTIREPFLVLDANFRVQLANHAFCRAFSVSEDETVGRLFAELGNGQWRVPALEKALAEVLASQAEITGFEIEHVFPLIGQKIMIVNARALERPSGAPMIFVAIEDVTSNRRAAAELARTSAELARSNRDLEQFAFVASHDLQEPLRKIRSFGELLVKAAGDNLSGEARDYLDRMSNAAVRMQNLLTDLLSFARARVRPAKLSEVNLTSVCREALVDLDAAIKEAGATISIGQLPVVRADPSQFRQLFQNLFSNAIKYRRPGLNPEITVAAKTGATDASRAEALHKIEVKDNGIGFEAAHASTLFEPFRRLHGRFEYEGNGIGLAICRTIVERHGGTIEAAGLPGVGATFTILLPKPTAIEEAA